MCWKFALSAKLSVAFGHGDSRSCVYEGSGRYPPSDRERESTPVCVLLGNCVTVAGQGASVSWVLLSKERGGEERPVANLCEISGLIYAALVYVSVSETNRRREYVVSTVMKL